MLVTYSMPTDSQAIFDLHTNANSTDLAVGDPRNFVDIPGLIDDQFIFIRKLSVLEEVTDVALTRKTISGPYIHLAFRVPGALLFVYRTKPIFDSSGGSEAITTDDLPEANNKHVSKAAMNNDLSITTPFLGVEHI